MEKTNHKQLIKNTIMGVSAFLIYMILSNIQGLPFQLLGIDTATLPMFVRIIYLIFYSTNKLNSL